jgi:hypothetical protein
VLLGGMGWSSVLAIPDLEADVVSLVGLVLMSIGMIKVGGCGERSDVRRRALM